MKRHPPPSPAFIQAMQEYERISSRYGIDSEQEREQLRNVLSLAPQSLKDEMHQKAKEMGLIPPPSGYTDDGQPIYSNVDLAKHFGVSVDELNERLDQLDPQHTGI